MKILDVLLAVIIVMSYNVSALKFASGILKNFKKGFIRWLSVAFINTALLFDIWYLQIPYPAAYPLLLVVITAEFCVLSESKVLSAFFGSSIFMVHLSTLNLFCTSLYAFLRGVTPYAVSRSLQYFSHSISLTCGLALLMLIIFRRIVSQEDIIAVLYHKTYSLMISAIAFFMVVYTCIDSHMLLIEEGFPNTFYICATTGLLTVSMFYVLLNYTIHCAQLSVYKERMSDQKQEENELSSHLMKLENQKNTDYLTGCFNRSYVEDLLAELFAEKNGGFCVIFLDMDGLKYVNDTLGHEMGDAYIRHVACALKETVPEDTGCVARFAGDEFVVITRTVPPDKLPAYTLSIQEHISSRPGLPENVHPSASLGYVYVDKTLIKEGPGRILREADRRMRLNKQEHYGEK